VSKQKAGMPRKRGKGFDGSAAGNSGEEKTLKIAKHFIPWNGKDFVGKNRERSSRLRGKMGPLVKTASRECGNAKEEPKEGKTKHGTILVRDCGRVNTNTLDLIGRAGKTNHSGTKLQPRRQRNKKSQKQVQVQ